jgi:hypothetical protein
MSEKIRALNEERKNADPEERKAKALESIASDIAKMSRDVERIMVQVTNIAARR